jgi:hypothetical protein
MAFSLCACGSTVGNIDLEAGQSAIYIQEDGVVSYAVSEKFDKEYFDDDELEQKIHDEVEDYNASKFASVDKAMDINNFKVSKETATLVLDFVTTYDFMSYLQNYDRVSEKELYLGPVSGNTEIDIEGKFVSPDKEKSVKAKDIEKMADANILIVSKSYKVQIDGTVEYMSENCKTDDEGIITTAKDGVSYIIYNN